MRQTKTRPRPAVQEREVLTRAQVMDYLQISHGTLHKLIKAEGLPHARIGKKVLFRKADVDRWLESKVVRRPGRPVAGK
jgi:excisionase family DNA binding protein